MALGADFIGFFLQDMEHFLVVEAVLMFLFPVFKKGTFVAGFVGDPAWRCGAGCEVIDACGVDGFCEALARARNKRVRAMVGNGPPLASGTLSLDDPGGLLGSPVGAGQPLGPLCGWHLCDQTAVVTQQASWCTS